MSFASCRRAARVLAVIVLLAPSMSFALTTTATPDESPKDACKSGSATTKNGVIQGGGKETDNYIVLRPSGEIKMMCSPAPSGEVGEVTYCDAEGRCTSVPKNSKEGQDLMGIFSAAYTGSMPAKQQGDTMVRTTNAEDVLKSLLTAEQVRTVDTSIIGKANTDNRLLDYGTVFDKITYSSAIPGSEYNKGTVERTANQVIQDYAILAKDPQPLKSPDLELPYDTSVYSISDRLKMPYLLDFIPVQAQNWERSSEEQAREFTVSDYMKLNPPPVFNDALSDSAANTTFTSPDSYVAPNTQYTQPRESTGGFSALWQKIQNSFSSLIWW